MQILDMFKGKIDKMKQNLKIINFENEINRDTSLIPEVDKLIKVTQNSNFKLKMEKFGILNYYSVPIRVLEMNKLQVNSIFSFSDKQYLNAKHSDNFIKLYTEIYKFIIEFQKDYKDYRFLKAVPIYKRSGNFIYKDGNYASKLLLEKYLIISLEEIGFDNIITGEESNNKNNTPIKKSMICIDRDILSNKETIKAILYLLQRKDELVNNLGEDTYNSLKNEKIEELLEIRFDKNGELVNIKTV